MLGQDIDKPQALCLPPPDKRHPLLEMPHAALALQNRRVLASTAAHLLDCLDAGVEVLLPDADDAGVEAI
jgi:hypothetical protein